MDTAEFFANEAASLANDALRALVSTVNDALDSAKTELKAPIAEMKGKADGLGEFLAIVIRVCTSGGRPRRSAPVRSGEG